MSVSSDPYYDDHAEHFRTHFRNSFGDRPGSFSKYEPAYRAGLFYATSDKYTGRSFSDLEPEMQKRYKNEYGGSAWKETKAAARHAFERGRSHASASGSPTASGSSNTASGDPGSAMRQA